MKLNELHVEHFGRFSDVRWEFGGRGFELVFGPNEAGKSTLLQLIRELFFGFELRNPYAFSEHSGDMAATATVEMNDGRQVQFRRRKGRKNAFVGRQLQTGDSIDARQWANMISGATRNLFDNIFGFSLNELANGQESLKSANIGEAIFGGALGDLGQVRRLFDGLEKEHQQLYTAAARTRPINTLLATIRTQTREVRDLQLKPRDYQQKLADRKRQGDRVDQLRSERDRLARDLEHHRRLAESLEHWQRLQSISNELQSLAVPENFPDDGDAQFLALRRRGEEAERELGDFQAELSDIVQQLDDLEPAPHLRQCQVELKQLEHQLDKIRGFRHDLPLRKSEADAIRARVAAQLKQIDAGWTFELVEKSGWRMIDRLSAERLASEHDEIEQQSRQLQQSLKAADADIAQLEAETQQVAVERPPDGLAELVETASQYESKRERLLDATTRLAALEDRATRFREGLSAPFGCEPSEVPIANVPLRGQVSEFRRRWEAVEQRLEMLQRDRRRIDADRADVRRKLSELNADNRVPEGQVLRDARERRQQGWQLIRRAFIEGQTVSEVEQQDWLELDQSGGLVEQYESAVNKADHIADIRQEMAELVARLEQLTAEQARLSQRYQEITEQLAELDKEKSQLESEWIQLWHDCPFEPLPPEGMTDWLNRHEELLNVVNECGQVRPQIATLTESLDSFDRHLEELHPGEYARPEQRLVAARRRVADAQTSFAQLETIQKQLDRKRFERRSLSEQVEEGQNARREWEARWQGFLADVQFPADWDLAIVQSVLEVLVTVRNELEKAEALEQRVSDMQTGCDEFERDVAGVVLAVTGQPMAQPAEGALEQVAGQVRRGLQDAESFKTLTTARDRLKTREATKQKQVQKIRAEQAALLNAAGAETESELRAVAERVRRWSELRREDEALQRALRDARGEWDEEAFAAELQAAEPAELESRCTMLETDLKLADQRFQEAVEHRGALVHEVAQMDQASLAAERLQQLEWSRAQLDEKVDRWATCLLAHTVMQQALDRFQREHQPAVLTDVARLVAKMTGGQYVDVDRKLDDQGTLILVDSGGKRKEPHELSTGTREQLYLAIRLAYILHYCRQSEPLPIILDDVLVNFDDRRLEHTIDVLAEIGETVQVIMLSCHQSTCDAISSKLPHLAPIVLKRR